MSDSSDHRSLEVQILGPVRAVADAGEVHIGGPRQQALLGALAIDIGRTVSVDGLADAVWDGSPPAAVDRTFKTYVAKLRKALADADGVDGSEVIRTETRGYRLDDDLVALDAALFEEEVARARDHLAGGEVADAELVLTRALGRWRGEALSGLADQSWARPEAVRLGELRVVAEELLATTILDAGRVAEAVSSAEALVTAHPERESAVRLLVLALYRAGRHGDALGTARQYRERLVEETGLDPSPQLAELERMVLEQDPRLDRPAGGRRLRGYVLHEVLATTPIGAVHRAEQPSIGREVAVTVVAAEQADDPDVVRLFEARMQQVASVEHRRVVPLYDYWRHPGGAYLVTRLPAGGTLAQQLARGGLDADQLVGVLREVAQAVAAAHERGVVHGALSPDAVVLDEQGHAFLWGFSLLPPEDGPRGDLAALAALADELMGRVGVGATTHQRDGVAALVEAVDSAIDGGVTSVASFVRSLDALIESEAPGSDAVELARPPVAPGPNPYRGLAAFRETDAEVFFGRDELIATIATRLARQPFVAVFGPSGSGKSSVVRAGVVPRLRSEGAYVTTMIPGTAPLAELGVALSRIAAVELPDVEQSLLDAPNGLTGVVGDVLPTPEAEAVLVIDQFEELFTMAPADEATAFLGVLRDALDHPLRRVRIIATVRADFLGQVLDHPIAGPLVHERSVLARPLTADELHEVVVGPAEVAGVAVEPALATAIVADATRFPGSLPMVQFALTEVFEAAQDATMELAAYRRIGGIAGVLGQRAEEVFAALDEAGQRASHQLFQRLVVPNDDGPPARRRAPRAELGHVPDAVIEDFGRARLLRFDRDEESREPTVEVTHEALFRAWPRLVAWIEADEDDLRLLGHLTVSASEWDQRGRLEADLYRGNRLDAAMEFAGDRRDELSAVERDFLDASRSRRARDAEADRRTVRRLRVLTGGLAVGLVLALVAGAVAVTAQRQEAAARQEEAATAFAAQADAFAFAAPPTFEEDPDLGMLYAAEAYAATGAPSAQRALLTTLSEPRITRVWDSVQGRCGVRSPDGRRTAVVSAPDLETDTGTATIHDDEQQVIASFEVPVDVHCVVPDASGDWLVAQHQASALGVRTADTGEEVAFRELAWDHFAMHPAAPELIVSDADGTVTRRALPSLDVIATHVQVAPGEHAFQVYSDSGASLLIPQDEVVQVIEEDGTTEVAHGGVVRNLTGLDGPRLLVIATPDALVVRSYDGGAVVRTIPLDGEAVADGGELPMLGDGRTVGIATTSGLEVFDVVSGRAVGPPIAFSEEIGFIQSDRDGLFFVTEANVNLAIDPYRHTAIGDVEVERGIQPDAWAATAPDGSSFAVLDDTPTIELLDSGTSVALPASPPSPDPIATTFAVGLLPDEEWVRLDLDAGRFERWSGDELVLDVDLTDEIPTGMVVIGTVLDTTSEHVLAIVTDDPELQAGHALVLDHRTGDVVGFFDPDPDLRGPRTFGVFVGDDRVMTYHVVGVVGLWSLDGTPAPGHVNVPDAGYGFGARDDGERLAVGTSGGAIRVLDGDGEVLTELTGVSPLAYDLDFTGDGRLVTRHVDGGTRLWDLGEGKLVGTLLQTSPHAPVWPATVERGQLLLPFDSGLVRLDLDPDRWLEAACATVARALRSEEIETVAEGWAPQSPCGRT